jgi:hypothetical protein
LSALMERLAIGDFLLDTQCSSSNAPYSGSSNGWTNSKYERQKWTLGWWSEISKIRYLNGHTMKYLCCILKWITNVKYVYLLKKCVKSVKINEKQYL